MSYRLYGAHGSGSAIIEALLTEAGQPYDFVRVDLADNAQRDEAYAAVNPHRKVPTLITPEGETLTESAAIAITLDERHPQAGLLPPSGSPLRARALRWMIFAATELYPIIEIVDYPKRFVPDGAEAKGVEARAHEIWRSRWQTIEADALGDGPYLLGDQFSAVDVALTVMSRWDLPADFKAAHLPRLERLVDAVRQRPALQEVWSRNIKD